MATNHVRVPEETGEYTHAQVVTIPSGLMLGMFLGALDQTIVSTSIRTIADDLQGLLMPKVELRATSASVAARAQAGGAAAAPADQEA